MQLSRKIPLWMLSTKVSRTDFDLALGLLFQIGLTSSEKAKGPGRVTLRAALPAGLRAKSLIAELKSCERRLGRPLFHEVQVKKVSRGDWSRKYQRFLKPFVLIPAHATREGLQVDPRGRLPKRLRKDTLYIEAGLAFGTGTHATTRLAAEFLAEAMHSRMKPRVLDLGCGTGILAMTAKRLGAGRVLAVDTDTEALLTARGNFKRNRIRGIELKEDLRGVKGRFPVIVSNIGLNVLLEFRPVFSRFLAPQGDLILTGLLYRDVTPLLKAYRGWDLQSRCNRSGWAALRLSRSSNSRRPEGS